MKILLAALAVFACVCIGGCLQTSPVWSQPDNLSFKVETTNFVVGNSLQFSATRGFDQYRWDFDDGTVMIGNDTIVHSYSDSGTYHVRCYAGGQEIEENVTIDGAP